MAEGGTKRIVSAGFRLDKRVMAVIAMFFILLGGYMYFGSIAATGKLDFVDLEVQVASITLSPNSTLLGHEIIGIEGFNGVTVSGKVKAYTDVDTSGIWVAMQIHINAYCNCDVTGCGRTTPIDPHFVIPSAGRWILIGNLSGMKAGDVKPFSYTITADQIYRFTQHQPFAWKEGPPERANGFMGNVYVAIIDTGGEETRRSPYGYEVTKNVPKVLVKEKALTWTFNYEWKKLQSILVGPDGLTLNEHSITPELYPHGITIKTKMSATAAILIALIFSTTTVVGLFKTRRGRRPKASSLLLGILIVGFLIAIIAAIALEQWLTLIIILVAALLFIKIVRR